MIPLEGDQSYEVRLVYLFTHLFPWKETWGCACVGWLYFGINKMCVLVDDLGKGIRKSLVWGFQCAMHHSTKTPS